MADLSSLKFDEKGLIPAIIQDHCSNEVLMMAYMNREALEKTIATGETWFYSRSRGQLWHKGETSGHWQKVQSIAYDCDADTLLVKVDQTGVACHTGARSCFFNPFEGLIREEQPAGTVTEPVEAASILDELAGVIAERNRQRPEGSYTTYLFEKGIDKILKKVGEEAAEVIIAAKNRSRAELVYESGDLLYHLLVLLEEQKVSLEEIYAELAKRRK